MNPNTDPTPEKRLWTRTWDALVDANPILAKELLVTARTPTFVASLIVAPVVLGALVLMFRLGMNGFGSVDGRQLFQVYFTGLSIALGIMGAALGSTVVVQEREAGALDALKFSTLSPHRIVVGKWAAVVLAEAAVVVCTTPLLAFVLGLGGVSVGEACIALSIALACGLMTASVGVAVSAHAANTRRSLLVSLMASGLVGIGITIWVGFAAEVGRWSGPLGLVRGYFDPCWDGNHVAVLFVVPAYAVTTVLWLGHAAGTSALMDLSEDRSLPIKRWVLGVHAMGLTALLVCAGTAAPGARGTLAGMAMIATALLAAVLLFVFAGEPVRPTRRMQVSPRSSWVRALYPWCLAPSILFTLVASGIVLVSVPVLARASGERKLDALWAIAFLSALGGLVGAVAARRGAERARRLGAIALVALTFVFVLLRADSRGPTWVDGICPLWLDPEGVAGAQRVLVQSLVAWGLAASLSLASMLRAVRRQTAGPR